jgi:hypothetical protein
LPDPNAQPRSSDVNTTRLWSAQKHIVQSNKTSANNDAGKYHHHQQQQQQQGAEHWSSSYKQNYNSGVVSGGTSASATAPQFKVNAGGGKATPTVAVPAVAVPAVAVPAVAVPAVAMPTAGSSNGTVPVQSHINMTEILTGKDGKSGSRVRAAIQNSQQYTAGSGEGGAAAAAAAVVDGSNVAEPTAEAGNIGTENRGGGDENEDFEGKAIPLHLQSQETRTHPEVSLTTPSQSTVLVGAPEGGVDTRNGSLDSFHEDKMSVGLQTVPNQFCSAREALELKKLLLLSNGSRGGIVPSSTAVMDMYMVGKVIGVGSYGKVRAAWHRLTGGKVAIKTYDKSKLKDPAHWKRVHSEIKITEQVSHPRIARMYEAVETPKRMHLIMECLDGGNLCSYVKAKRRLGEEEAKVIFFQLMQGIEHLHGMRVTHRDVKVPPFFPSALSP